MLLLITMIEYLPTPLSKKFVDFAAIYGHIQSCGLTSCCASYITLKQHLPIFDIIGCLLLETFTFSPYLSQFGIAWY